MKQEILSKYLNKVKRFAWESGPSPMYSNVLIQGTRKHLTLSCTDGNTGIQQVVLQDENPIICECCVNVFKLCDTIDKIKKQSDISLKIKGERLEISDRQIKHYTPSYPVDQIFNIPKCDSWKSISDDLLQVIASVMPITDDSDAPIVMDGRQIFHANPKAVYYRLYESKVGVFSIDNKFVKRIFIDKFTDIGKIIDCHLFLKNNDCTIFVPLFNGKQLILDPVIKLINNEHIINCKVGVEELLYGYGIMKQIADQNDKQDVILDISKDNFLLQVLDSSYSLMNYLFPEDHNFKIKIPISHLHAITKATFVNKNEYITLKFALNSNTRFVVKSDDLLFIGGVYRM